MKVNYDPKKLRYGKIIIASDSDVDGSHIKNLFYTFIWNFCPELIEDGYVYALIPPLYKITEGKDTYFYLKNDEELENYRKKSYNKKYIVNRFKGLGEMDVEQTEECLLNEDTRILKQITVEDFEEADELFDELMGTDVDARKAFIQKNSKYARYVG